MLLLAFTVTDPEGEVRDEKVHVLSRHFDTQLECKQFVDTWEDTIRDKNVAHLKKGKLFTNYQNDPRIYYNHVGSREEFMEYNDELKYTDFKKFTDSESQYFNNQKFSA